MEFLVRGATEFDEPGVFMAFEETAEELTQNVRSLGFDLDDLVRQKKMALDYVRIERSEIEETGEYDLEGLFIRLGCAIDSIGAKRVVLDTIESLFSGLSNDGHPPGRTAPAVPLAQRQGRHGHHHRRAGRWRTLTRHGLEEYVSDCVIVLDHRVSEQLSTRRLRIVKYRGSVHGTNEYPFLIDEQGISVLPVTSLGLQHEVSSERISTGIARLDAMFGGQGYYRGSERPGFGHGRQRQDQRGRALCRCGLPPRRNAACTSPSRSRESQLVRNMRSIGIDLEPWIKQGLLHFHAARPTLSGLEMHLTTMHKWSTTCSRAPW